MQPVNRIIRFLTTVTKISFLFLLNISVKIISGELSKNSNNCNTQTQGYHNYQNNNYREEFHVPRYRKKREMMLVQKYVKKNSTNPAMKKSLLEDIGAVSNTQIFLIIF